MKYTSAAIFSFFLFGAAAGFPADSNPPPDERFKADLLVVIAHPDDETVIGAYLARALLDERRRVAVIYGTRGNEGGNAEGQEQAAALGAVREIEARRALAHFGVTNVWFLNGLDTPGQSVLHSLESWNHGDSLGRLVRLIRLTRPAVIATWLPDYVSGENHGDHQASGVLATEAFDLAGNPAAFSEQIVAPRNRSDVDNFTEGLRPWQPEKLYFFTDAANTAFLDGRGPVYAATDRSPARGETYARLAAEECSYHLTQVDSGQMARQSLATNDLKYFNQPVKFVLGKSLVGGQVTGDLFEGVTPAGIEYHPPPPYTPQYPTAPTLELGESWSFYKQFWPAHGLDRLAGLVSPEVMLNFASFLWVPVEIHNPTDRPMDARLSIDTPEGWRFIRGPRDVAIAAGRTYTGAFELETPEQRKPASTTLTVRADSAGTRLSPITLRVDLNGGALPQ